MSTRSTITVSDGIDSFSIYRHCDGYPDSKHGVLAGLAQALPFAWPLPRFEAMDFAAAIVRAWKQPGGGNIYLTTGRDAHGDTEFHYDVVAKRSSKSIKVTVYTPTYPDEQSDERVWVAHSEALIRADSRPPKAKAA